MQQITKNARFITKNTLKKDKVRYYGATKRQPRRMLSNKKQGKGFFL